MAHPTSVWAVWYGLPDPAVRADPVLAASPPELRALAECCRAAGDRMLAGAGRAGLALAVLQHAWSADPPRDAIAGMQRAARSSAAIAADIAAGCDRFAATAGSAAAAVRRCYAEADAQIAAGNLLPDGPMLALVGLSAPLLAARKRVVADLWTGVAAASDRLQQAAAELVAVTATDPRTPLQGMSLAGWAGGGRGLPGGPGAAGRVDRDNRDALAADLRSGSGRRRGFALGVQRALAGAGDDRPVQLLAYDPARPRGQGGVAIAIGDVSTADNVAVLVPGVGNSPADLSGTLDAAAGLVRAADRTAPGASTAVVVWLGYDAPLSWIHDPDPLPAPALEDTLLAGNGIDAIAGGADLAAFCGSLRRWTSPSAAVTLIGHSYGSTVVSQAATRLGPDAGIDDIVLLASPGAGQGVRSAGDYRAVPADHVYVLSMPDDPVTQPVTDLAAGLLDPLGGAARSLTGGGAGGPFGADPASARFGAQLIDAPSGEPAVALGGLGPVMAVTSIAVDLAHQHQLRNYLGGAALAPVAAVVAGRYSRVKVRRGR
ncbi:MAG TPA: alpha/beta hydrolase [Nakamurella sp.]|nr:alpha/beta hydrolase [Nakamurella sp.]